MTQESASGQVTIIIMQKWRHIPVPTPLSVQVCIEVFTWTFKIKVLKLVLHTVECYYSYNVHYKTNIQNWSMWAMIWKQGEMNNCGDWVDLKLGPTNRGKLILDLLTHNEVISSSSGTLSWRRYSGLLSRLLELFPDCKPIQWGRRGAGGGASSGIEDCNDIDCVLSLSSVGDISRMSASRYFLK